MNDSGTDDCQHSHEQRAKNDGFRRFLWNPDKGEVLGRTGKRWGQLLLFYLIFYGTLTALFAVCLNVFYLTRSDDRPTYNFYDDKGHPIMQVPGIGMRPRLVTKTTSPEIDFSTSDSNSYSEYVNSIKDYLRDHSTSESITTRTCDGQTTGSCPFDQVSLGECDGISDPDFGYSSGEPCVLLKINRIIGWVPESEDNSNISISCKVDTSKEKSSDKKECSDCVGSPEYYPPGFPVQCFPYCGATSSPNYHSPIVMVKFKGIEANGQTVRLICKANVKDFVHNSDTERDQALAVRFALKINS